MSASIETVVTSAGIGAVLGLIVSLVQSTYQNRQAAKKDRLDEVRTAAAAFASNVTQYVWLARQAPDDPSPEQVSAIETARIESRRAMENIRLIASEEAQRCARLSQRYAWAIMIERQSGVDPRQHDDGHLGEPNVRFENIFRDFLVAARTELEIPNPQHVYTLDGDL